MAQMIKMMDSCYLQKGMKTLLILLQIYVINLKRRPEKRIILEETFKKLRLNVTFWDAVDGK